MVHADLLSKIRTIPDFPKPGILFYDITTLLADADGLRETIDRMAADWQAKNLDCIVAIDARGFILGSALAYKLGLGMVLVRKKGKLPHKTESVSYDLEYGSAEVEVHIDALAGGKRALIVDDLLATGGTAAASIRLVQKTGGQVAGCAFVIELDGLGGRAKLGDVPIRSLLTVAG